MNQLCDDCTYLLSVAALPHRKAAAHTGENCTITVDMRPNKRLSVTLANDRLALSEWDITDRPILLH